MDFSAIKDLYIGSTPVQSAWLNGSKVWGRKPAVDEQAIRDAMVLWYDLKRQGATNENMAADPTLRDLSGNGHDATCYNFAWAGNSGIGGVAEDYLSEYYMNFLKGARGRGTVTHNTIHITEILSNSVNVRFFESQHSPQNIKSYKIKVSGIEQGKPIKYSGAVISGESLSETIVTIEQDGEYELPEVDITKYNNIGFRTEGWYGTCDITIEQLPQYPHALVSDGVDDYAMVEGLPLFTTETGYTVIAKREYVSLQDKKSNGILCGKGAFQLENFLSNESSKYNTVNFGQNNNVGEYVEGIVVQTSKKYEGKNIVSGDASDANTMNLFKGGTYDRYSNVAIYSLLLFDRDLTVDEINWVKTNLIEGNDDDAEWYGVEFYTTSPNPDCIRIGNMDLHRSLPVQSQMKGCLLNDDGEVIKYLNTSDWTSETRDGSQGQVMVEIPEHYVKFETDGTKRRVKMSITPIVGYKKIGKYYISAYEATVQRSANKLCSVVNTDEDYRGGNNNSANDAQSNTFLGKAATSISRTNFRTYARNRKEGSTEWNCMTYDAQKDLYWLFVVEYATLNSQKAFNAAKTAEGYAQGGLGNGVTSLDGTKWNTFNGYYPVIPCGHTDSLGNGTGEVDYQMPEEYDTNVLTVKVPRYRGIENPFGHLWQWTDGINVRISPNKPDGDGLSKVYVCSDPSKFNDTNYDGYTYVGDEVRTQAYVKEVIFGEGGEIMPSVVGGSTTTYFCDYHYTNIPTSVTLRGVRFGGDANIGVNDGANAGFVCANSRIVTLPASTSIGSRLCFIPNNND